MKISGKFKLLNLVLLIAVFLSLALNYTRANKEKVNLDINELVPLNIGNWKGKALPISDYILNAVKADSQIWRHYYDDKGISIEVWIAYYDDQLKSTAHNPNTCYNGQGWSTEKSKVTLTLDNGQNLDMTRILLIKDNIKNLSYYWYVASGKNAGTEFTKNLFKFYYGIINNRSDLLFLRFSTIIDDQDIKRKENIIKDFIKTYHNLLKTKLPDSFYS